METKDSKTNKNDDSSGLIPRQFRQLTDSQNISAIRVLQYNILADALSVSTPTENFCKVPQECLQWATRSQQLAKQLKQYNSDIMCLEEVEEGHFKDFLIPLFPGYHGSHAPKKLSPCTKVAENDGPDGVAVFFRMSRFTLKESVQRYLTEENGEEGNNAVLINVLSDKHTGCDLIIGATHLKAKHGFEERRRAQTESCIAVLKEVASKHPTASVILCGDFNGEPSEPFYSTLQHAGYVSAFVTATGSEPEFTTWKIRPSGEMRHTIDYVWVQKQQQQQQRQQQQQYTVCGVLDIMKDADVPPERFPSHGQPSDHIPLCFEFISK